MVSKELRSAPDLVKGSVYGKTEGGGKRIVATIYSSKSLGLEEREDIAQPAKSEEQSQANSRRGGSRAYGGDRPAESKE